MKLVAKVILLAVVGIVACIGVFILFVESQWSRAERQARDVVSQFGPGTPFSAVISRIGRPRQSYTNAEAIEVYGTRKDESFITNSTLHMFVHRGPPFLWILVYTDKDSQTVLHAAWKHM